MRIKLNHIFFAASLPAVLLFCGGCIFSTRNAEDPGGEGTSWVVPDFPEKVFDNMTTGLEDLSGANYEKSLGEAFMFIPLPGDKDQYPGIFDLWNKTREVEAMNRLISDASDINLDFKNLTIITQDISAAEFEGRYDIMVVSKAVADTSIYRGKARFSLQEGSKGWELLKWEDIESDAQYPSWGFLRAQL